MKETPVETFLLPVSKSSGAVNAKACGQEEPHKSDPYEELNGNLLFRLLPRPDNCCR